MKNLLTLAVLVLLLSAASSAQETRTVRFGLKAAPNFGWLKPNSQELSKDGLGAKLGFAYGIMMDFSLYNSENYYFSTGFELSSNGGKLLYPSVLKVDSVQYPSKTERTHKLSYVNIPFAIKMRTNPIGYITYFGSFGGSAGFNINADADDEFKYSTTNILVTNEDDIDISDDIRLLRAELIIAAGAEYNVSGNTYIVFGLSWHNGFTNILDGTSVTPDPIGFGSIDPITGEPAIGSEYKAISNYLSIDLGVFF